MNQVNNLVPEIADTPTVGDARDPGIWMAFVAAVQFLTRIPLYPQRGVSPTSLQRSPIFFPLVGALIGVVTAALIGIGNIVWPVWLAVILAFAVEAWLTGALHEDAVADFCDAFGGGWTREQVLMILKDSRIGTYGTIGLLFAVSIRAAATIAIIEKSGPTHALAWGSAIVASCMVGRWVMVLAMVCMPSIPRSKSLAYDMAQGLTAWELLCASVGGIPFAIGLAWFHPVQSFAAIVLLLPTICVFFWYVKRRIGGISGDCVGCIGYAAQVVVLLAAAIGQRSPNV